MLYAFPSLSLVVKPYVFFDVMEDDTRILLLSLSVQQLLMPIVDPSWHFSNDSKTRNGSLSICRAPIETGVP